VGLSGLFCVHTISVHFCTNEHTQIFEDESQAENRVCEILPCIILKEKCLLLNLSKCCRKFVFKNWYAKLVRKIGTQKKHNQTQNQSSR